jgi:hypothetical protein
MDKLNVFDGTKEFFDEIGKIYTWSVMLILIIWIS